MINLKYHKRKLCLLFIFIFFIYGICTSFDNTESCTFNANTSTRSSFLSHYFIPEPTQCTFEMLGNNYCTYLTSTNFNLNSSKYIFHFLYAIPCNPLSNYLFFHLCKIELARNPLRKSHFYTIEYIHHKDGKKLFNSFNNFYLLLL